MTNLFLFRAALNDIARPGRALVAALLALVPAIIALAWRLSVGTAHFPRENAYNALEAGLVFGFTLVILAVMFGTGVVSQEVEQKTIVYLLTRPVRRVSILLSRFTAALALIVVTTWISSIALALVTFGPSNLHASPLGRDLLILPIGALAYGAVFLFLATFINRPLIWGLLFVFGWEWWVPQMPGSFKMASLMSYLRVLAPHPAPEGETVDMATLLTSLSPTTISSRLSWEVLIAAILICLLGAMLVFSRREYVPRDDAI